jgi:hypothetical protein
VNLTDITLLRHETIFAFVVTVVTIFSRVTQDGEDDLFFLCEITFGLSGQTFESWFTVATVESG